MAYHITMFKLFTRNWMLCQKKLASGKVAFYNLVTNQMKNILSDTETHLRLSKLCGKIHIFHLRCNLNLKKFSVILIEMREYIMKCGQGNGGIFFKWVIIYFQEFNINFGYRVNFPMEVLWPLSLSQLTKHS